MSEARDWFEAVWQKREEQVYPELFGQIGQCIFPLSVSLFTETFKQDFDPRWLHCGVFESPPCDQHKSWLYVTSGMSNAWEDEQPDADGPSGLGCEFVFESSVQGNWAILRIQQLMAFQILLAHDRYPGRDLLSSFDRIPLRGSITPEDSVLTHLMIAPPVGYPASFGLESGQVDLLAVVGISDAEAQFARDHDGAALLQILQQNNAFPVTDPTRQCTVGR